MPKQEDVRPDYYKVGGIEPIEYMEAKMTEEQFSGFCLGNVYKYVGRYLYKGGLEDLRKARYYLDRLIELEGKRDERSDG